MAGKVGDPYLPGFNSPLDVYTSHTSYVDGSEGFQDPPNSKRPEHYIENNAGHWCSVRRTILEICMLAVMNILTDKPNWRTKIKDETIRSRWLEEIKAPLSVSVEESTALDEHAIEFNETAEDNARVVERTAQFVIRELLDKADEPHDFTTVLGSRAADIIKYDDLISEEFKEQLQTLCKQLADSQSEPWWQPGEEGIIRHLIHPSLYALEFGRTKIKTSGVVPLLGPYKEGDTVIPAQESTPDYSHELQWLPAEVSVEDGKTTFTSTINGLDPAAHPALYETLAKLLDQCLTPWSHCLAVGHHSVSDRILCRDELETFKTPKEIPPMPRGLIINRYGSEYDPQDDMESDDDGEEEEGSIDLEHSPERPHNPSHWGRRFWDEHCVYNVCPAPRAYESWRAAEPHTPLIDLTTAYRSLQVILKISSIDLTPANPKYPGGNWHVEGLANEHICATAIYYYDSKNVKQDSISFRAGASMDQMEDFSYPQSEFAGLERVFGTELVDGTAIQDLPRVQTREGRLLVFPNVFQHCVSPFELEDPSKPGHRKIVVMWLVNPQKRIISTAHVPPQQAFMTREEAIANQKRIMAGRSVSSNGGAAYGEVDEIYYFCEH